MGWSQERRMQPVGRSIESREPRCAVAEHSRAAREAPGPVQVLLMDQEQSNLRLYMYRNGKWNNFASDPPPDADDQRAG